MSDVSEKLIKTCLNYYGLDPCHYFSSPGLSCDAMLKTTRVKLDLISDIDIHLFIEKGMRSGISYIAKTHSKANNQYMENYDSNEDNKCILYWDANNLYRWALNQPLPYSRFNFLSKEEIKTFALNKSSEYGTIGYVLGAYLESPSELHDIHNDYPLAPEKLEISSNMLSKYCSEIANKYGIKVGGVNNLVSNLRDKRKYIVH